MGRWILCVWLSSVLACLPVHAAEPATGFPLLAQNDLLMSDYGPDTGAAGVTIGEVPQPEIRIRGADGAIVTTTPPLVNGSQLPAQTTTGNPPLVQFPLPAGSATRLVLLLPRQSPALRSAADAVMEGFMVAARRDQDARFHITVVETGDDPEQILNAYQTAQAQADIIVGPLTRSGVAAVAQRGQVNKPTLALAQFEPQGKGDAQLPARMVSMGLSLEDEARQVARQAVADGNVGRAYIVASGAAWQRRAARAFAVQWGQLRQTTEQMDIPSSGSWLEISGLQNLKGRLQAEQPALVFVALDAQQASQVREATGAQVPMVGTSQLNPRPGGGWPDAMRRPELNGVQLVDMPWVLQPDHPAVMTYRGDIGAPRRGIDLERLVGLGIDAWRVVREMAASRQVFEIDGVTGRLQIDMNQAGSRFVRTSTPAVYEEGVVVNMAKP